MPSPSRNPLHRGFGSEGSGSGLALVPVEHGYYRFFAAHELSVAVTVEVY